MAAALVVVPVTILTLASPAAAVACTYPTWAEGQTYTVGTKVTYNGRGYEARQTHTAHPGANWNPAATPTLWTDLGVCDSGPPPPTNPPPTTGPPNPPPPGGSCSPAWESAKVYTGGNEVSYNGRNYRAKWWTQNQAPGTNDVWADLGSCTGGDPPPTTGPPSPPPSNPPPPPPGTPGSTLMGYFVQWGVYQRAYHVKNIVTSGSASKLNYLNYAFGNVTNGQCVLGDTYADYDRFYQAGESVDGVADTWDAGALRGNFNQLRKLKKAYPNIRILFSFGGWTWSGGFGQAAANPAAFASSCYNLIHDPRWNGVFDGIDLDWEYPNACGLTCDASGAASFKNLMQAMRARFGNELVTAAITADGTSGGKIDAADYGGAAQYVNWYNVMTYDFFGGWAPTGPTAPHSPLSAIPGNAQSAAGFNSDAALDKLRSKGIPSSKLLIGIGFYGRGWAGVSQAAPGGSASGPAPGTYEQGIEDYKVLKSRCPATSTVAGTAYGLCGGQWWSYDTPGTIAGKMSYAKSNGLGGAFFWELTGDTANGELIGAMRNGL